MDNTYNKIIEEINKLYYKGINLTNLNDIEVYELVLKRKIPNFPPGYWCSVTNVNVNIFLYKKWKIIMYNN